MYGLNSFEFEFCTASVFSPHQGREIIAIVPLENGAFCTIFSENFHNF
jgi:hypothetical protein